MVTIKDVAEEAGVSIATVSSVINDSRPVAQATREKVLKVINEMGYKTNPVARALKVGNTKRILYIVPSIKNLVFAQFINQVQHSLIKKGYDLILLNNEARVDLTKSYLSIIHSSNIDGLIMTQTRSCGKLIVESCQRKNIPFVILFEPDIFKEESMVTSDEKTGMDQAVEYLISQGHHKIALLKVADSRNQNKRFHFFKEKLAESGLEFNNDWLITTAGHDEKAAYTAVTNYLQDKKPEFTALIGCNDFLTLGAIRAFRKYKLKIPAEISLIGYDDSIAEYLYPALTTVGLPKKKLAKKSVEILLNKIKQPDYQAEQNKFSQQLIIRDSVANLKKAK